MKGGAYKKEVNCRLTPALHARIGRFAVGGVIRNISRCENLVDRSESKAPGQWHGSSPPDRKIISTGRQLEFISFLLFSLLKNIFSLLVVINI